MLVYANSFIFNPSNGPDQIIQIIAKWIGNRARQKIDSTRLANGIRELYLRDESILISRSTISPDNTSYPYYFGVSLSHADEGVPGRRWVTEVGLKQNAIDEPIECSILLKTDEISARVTAPIYVTRPKLVEQLIDTCLPDATTPGLNVRCLDEKSASAFLHEVERSERRHPIVIISCDKSGNYPVASSRLRSILIGLAEVVEVPSSADTFTIEKIVGRNYFAFGGAIKIIFPERRRERGPFYETVLLSPNQISDFHDNKIPIESEVLATITHRTNLPYSWRHVSLAMVDQMVLRTRLTKKIEEAKASDNADDLLEYVELLEMADQEIHIKDSELTRLQDDYEAKEHEVRSLQSNVDNLKHALAGRQASEDAQVSEIIEAIAPIREYILAVVNKKLSLQQALKLISILFAERVTILENALTSSAESDRGGFRHAEKAFDLLLKLATDYWQALADGKGDQQAKSTFGHNAYAQNEGEALSAPGRQKRTFTYHGQDILMEKHLKIGVKDSSAETLRIHFEWIANDKKIVIGHCGEHLNF